MTAEQRNEYVIKWNRHHRKFENYYTKLFTKALQEQVKQYLDTGNVAAITSTPIYTVLVDLYTKVSQAWARKTGVHRLRNKKLQKKAIDPNEGVMGFNQRIVDLMREVYFIDLANDALDMTETTRNAIIRVLGEAAKTGASLDQIVRMLQAESDLGKVRARLIARTETTASSNVASLINAKDSGLAMDKEWVSISDRRRRLSHEAIDGRTIGIDDYFVMQSGVTMQNPGARKQKDGQDVPIKEVANCFLPDQLTGISFNEIKHAFRNWYNGQIVTIKTSGKNTFTCTPNHPILTTKGWIAAGKLTKSHNLVKSSFIEQVTDSDFYVKNRPSKFEQIFNSLFKKYMTVGIGRANVDFYGDTSASDVDIIDTSRRLTNRGKTGILESVENAFFKFANFRSGLLLCKRAFCMAFYKKLRWQISKRLVGFLSQFLLILKGGISHAGIHGVASISLGNTRLIQSVNNNVPRNAENISDFLDTFTGVIHSDKIIDIEFKTYSGHVYTFETKTQMYDINSYVARNCRCVLIYIEKRDSKGRLIKA